jgi:hypothetical protein
MFIPAGYVLLHRPMRSVCFVYIRKCFLLNQRGVFLNIKSSCFCANRLFCVSQQGMSFLNIINRACFCIH